MHAAIEADYRRWVNRPGNWFQYLVLALKRDGFRAVFLYRLGKWCVAHRLRFLTWLCLALMHHTAHCWLNLNADIGPGFLISHVGSVGIGGGVHMGTNCDARRSCSIGGNFNKTAPDGRTKPWIGDNVSIGIGGVIIGPVMVGSNVVVGANSVVNRDVPDNVIVFGVPAKVVRDRWNAETGRRL